MITINLLPDEFRVEERTSPTRLLVIVASLLIALLAGGFYLFVHFYQLATAKDELAKSKDEREKLRVAENENKRLNELIASFKDRDRSVDAVRALQIPFSRKLSELAELMGAENHPVWFTNLMIKPYVHPDPKAQAQSTLPNFEWMASASCASDSLNQAIAFYKAIQKDDKFYRDFLQTEVPRYMRTDIPGNYQQKIAWKFNLRMIMQMQPQLKKEPETKAPEKK